MINLFSSTRRYKRHQNKVKVKGLGSNSSYLAGFSIFVFIGSMKTFKQLAKKKLLKIFLSGIKTKVAITFLKQTFFFFFTENRLGAERVKRAYQDREDSLPQY